MRKIVTLVYALVATSCLAQEPISDSTSYGACIMQNGSIVGINEDKPFAMHSVMKFPQALYVAAKPFRMENCWNCLSDRVTTMPANSFSSFAASPKR